MNKIRSEVDAEAEIINGSIIDPSLDGKIRVSIVATSLDGQQPESKSVINMVHRIQNRNPGYSDFSTNGPTSSFGFTNNNTNPLSHGANALKLENEVVTGSINEPRESIDEVNNQYHEELLKNQDVQSVIENTSNDDEISFSQEAINTKDNEISNDLREFGVDTEEPDLFNSDHTNLSSDDLLGTSNEENDEDDLEIPAFLRRQKN